MAQLGTAFVDVKADFGGFNKQVSAHFAGFGRQMGAETDKAMAPVRTKFAAWGKSIGAALGAAALVQFGKTAITTASSISESLSKNEKLFGSFAASIDAFSQTSARSFGISRQAALEYTGVFGNLFRSMGMTEQASASQSIALTKLAADMASFNNTSLEQALEAIRSGLVGETEPLRKFGVNMNDATLKAQALKMGLIDSTKEGLTPQTKAMAAAALITAQTAAAHGDFARTSDGLANQQKILKARLSDVSAQMGAVLVPIASAAIGVFTKMLDVMRPLVEWFKEHKAATAALGTTLAILIPVIAGYKTLAIAVSAATRGWAIAQALLNFAMNANPFIRIATLIIALATAFVVAYKNSEDFRNAVDRVVATVTRVITPIVEFTKSLLGLGGAGSKAGDAFRSGLVGALSSLPSMLGNIFKPVLGIFTGLATAFGGVIKTISGVLTGDWSRAWTGILQIVTGIWGAMRSMISGAIGPIVLVVRTGWGLVQTATSTAWGAIRGLVAGAVSGLVGVVSSAFGSVVGAVRGGMTAAVGAVSSFVGAFLAAGRTVFSAVTTGVRSAAGTLLGAVRSAVSNARDAIGGLVGSFFNAGMSLIRAVGDGIRAGAQEVVNAAKWVADRVRSILPFSEPKDPSSPLRGLANAGVAIVKNIADGVMRDKSLEIAVYNQAQRVVAALRKVTSLARIELGQAMAALTGPTADDISTARKLVTYWQGRLVASKGQSVAAQTAAAQGLKQAQDALGGLLDSADAAKAQNVPTQESAWDWLTRITEVNNLAGRAGQYTQEQITAATQSNIAAVLAGTYGGLTDKERLTLLGDLRTASGFLGSFATGGVLPGDGFYYGHKGEMVVPPVASLGSRGGIGGGSSRPATIVIEKLELKVGEQAPINTLIDARVMTQGRVTTGQFLAGVRR